MSGKNRPPGPLPAGLTGNQATDGKLAPAKLAALLDGDALDLGESSWDGRAVARLTPKDRKVFDKVYQDVGKEVTARGLYLDWAFGRVLTSREGQQRVLALARPPTPRALRIRAMQAILAAKPGPALLREAADAVDPSRWKPTGSPQAMLDDRELYRYGATARLTADPRAAFDRFAPSFTRAALASKPGVARAAAILLGKRTALDPRWVAVLAPLVGHRELGTWATMWLEALPADPVVIEPILAALGKNPAKVALFPDGMVRLLGRVADARCLPYLAAALERSWMHWSAAFEGFRTADDPAMAAVVRAWLKKNGAADRNKVGRPLIAFLERNGTVAAKPARAAAAVTPSKPAPRSRGRAPAMAVRPPRQSLATQREALHAMFAAAGLAAKADRILELAVQAYPRRVAAERSVKVGASKVGGLPDLPRGTPWPSVEGVPLDFIAQFDLAAVAKAAKLALPRRGLLSFFVATDADTLGYLEVARVLHLPTKPLVRTPAPDGVVVYAPCKVDLHPVLSAPLTSSRQLDRLLTKPERKRYQQDVDAGMDAELQLLGYRAHGWDHRIKPTEALLLQCPSDNQADMTWGDVEVLSFVISRKALAAGDFSRVRCQLGD